MYDILIIGAGVSGCAAARELSRYQASVCVLEKEEDVCCGTSKANSAIVHAGYDAVPGSLMARMNVMGNDRMGDWAEELDIDFRRIGSMVVCFGHKEMDRLQMLYQQGLQNGVSGLKILRRQEAAALEPGLSPQVYAALYAPKTGIICPFELNLALAENAYDNGVEFRFNTIVTTIQKINNIFEIGTNQGVIHSRTIINAAGVFADEIHNMVCQEKMEIIPRKGEYCLLDRSEGGLVSHVIFQLPNEHGKGVLVTPTVHGNLLLGPTSEELSDKEDTATTADGLQEVMKKAAESVKGLRADKIITSFAGLRAHRKSHDFLVEESEVEGFFDCAGIESPGLSSCPEIGSELARLLKEKLSLCEKPDFVKRRRGITKIKCMTDEDRCRLIQAEPAYGRIVCRCEMITEGEILEAIHKPLGAKSLDGIKRRVRAGMGRCQAGFCTPKIMEIISKECEMSMAEVTKMGNGSFLI